MRFTGLLAINAEIFGELGLGAAELEALAAEGVV